MKAKLEFDLPEEREEFKLANHGSDYYCTIEEILRFLREKIKYHSDDIPQEEIEVYEKVREEIYQLLDEYGVKSHF